MKTVVSVVVPLHNEEENVSALFEEIRTVFSGLPEYDLECLFVNDGSTDGTRDQLEGLRAAHSCVRPLHLMSRQGQSAALVAGMWRAKGEYILTMDGDLQNDPRDFPKVLGLLKEYDCVCGYRQNRHDSWVRKTSSKIGNAARRAALKDGIRDAGCGTKGFRRRCVDHIVPFNGVHRYFAVMMRSAGLSLVECPVHHRPRRHGVSKYGINDRLWRGMYDLVGVRWLKRRHINLEVEGDD